jgi:hypothetical protein
MGSTFAEATAVTDLGGGVFEGCIDATWGVFGNANGGYLLAIMARAAMQGTGRDFPYVVSASYLRPGKDGPVRVEVETIRAGRTATHARVVLSQGEGPALDATMVLGDAPSGSVDHPEKPPAMPVPETCWPITDRAPGIDILDRMTFRYAPGFGPREPEGEPIVRGWVDLIEPEATDSVFGLLAADALVPSVQRLGKIGWAPTVQLTAYLHAVPAPGPLAVEVALGEMRDEWFDESMVVTDTTGRMIVRARQLARLPR